MNKHLFKKTKTNVAVRNMIAVGLFAAAVMPVQAAQFQVGDFDLSINSTVSAGTSFRAEGRDRALYAVSNTDQNGVPGTGLSNTSDDGNLNYDNGDTFSTIIKGVHDFDLRKDNYGFFGRVKWFYDYEQNKGSTYHGHEPTGNARNQRLNDNGFHPYARFDGIDVLDAFGYINTDIGGKPVDLRLGRQVISWGESLFIQSPISGLNTIDISALRRPGAELKEGFTPSEMLYMNLGLTDNTSLEAFYQLKWRKTVLEGCGTYFSTSDSGPDGCDRLAFAAPLIFGATGMRFGDQIELGGAFNNVALGATNLTLPPVIRDLDRQPDDGGQFGFALRSYVSELDTEFGGYFMNYHSRLPTVSFRTSSTPGPNGPLPYALGGTDGRYVVDYAEDVSVLGLSFATNVSGWSWAGEFSHAMDLPVQINQNQLLLGALLGGLAPALGTSTFDERVQNTQPGEIARGYDEFDVSQIQTTFIRTFDRALGSSQAVFAAEVAAVYVHDLPGLDVQKYGRNPVFGTVRPTEGYVTDFSWGYRMRGAATYRDVFLGTDLIPQISFSHDVDGWSPEPGGAFNEGRQSVGLTLGLEFDANTKAAVSYTTFTNAADFDPLRDRDFISLTGSYSF